MFATLQNPMAYIIAFQMGVLLVPAFVALGRFLADEKGLSARDAGPQIEHISPDEIKYEHPQAA